MLCHSIVVRCAAFFSGHLATVTAQTTKHNSGRVGTLIFSHDPLSAY